MPTATASPSARTARMTGGDGMELENLQWHAWEFREGMEYRAFHEKGHSIALQATLVDGAWDDLSAMEECQNWRETGKR